MEQVLTPPRTGRPSKCGRCGDCERCKRAAYMRAWWAKWTPEEKREKTARRDPDKVREQDRKKMAKRRATRPDHRFKEKARMAVGHSVEAGQTPPASFFQCNTQCGEMAEEWHHFAGYEEKHWFFILPLCKSCHKEEG